MVEKDDEDEISKYVFMASINLYESLFEGKHRDFNFEKQKCLEQIRKIIIHEVSEFCRYVSIRVDEGATCFLIINKLSNKKDYIRKNPITGAEPKIINKVEPQTYLFQER